MAVKTKENYKTESTEVNARDCFYTPRYATELLIPYIPKDVTVVWECMAGDGNISKVLEDAGYRVISTDLQTGTDFFDPDSIPDELLNPSAIPVIITNPAFGIKEKTYKRCVQLGFRFALLIPADYSGWLIKAYKNGAQRITPTRRVDFITPFITALVHRNELHELIQKETGEKWKKFTDIPKQLVDTYDAHIAYWDTWRDIPEELIAKHSSSDFHTLWLTRGFGLKKDEIFVELSNTDKKRIF